MKKQIISFGVVAGLLAISNSASAAHPVAYDFFPMDSGNVWIFHTVENKTDHRLDIVEVDQSVYAGVPATASVLSGLFGSDIPVWDHVNSANMWTHDNSQWSKFVDFDASYGETWGMRTGPCNDYDVEYINGADAVTPAGTFVAPKTFNFDFTPDANVKCAYAPIQQAAFAQDVGLVSIERATSTSDLLFGRVDGVIVAAGAGETRYDADGVAYTMALVADEITQPHPIYCFTTPCPQPVESLRLALIVENLTDHTVTRSYANSQQFDVDVFELGGENVTSWSDDKMFLQATTELTLQPGEREVYYVELPMLATKGKSEGATLAGEYQVVSYLTGVDQNGVGASKLSTTIAVYPGN